MPCRVYICYCDANSVEGRTMTTYVGTLQENFSLEPNSAAFSDTACKIQQPVLT